MLPLAASSTSSARCLVIHFDINETILIGDEAGGDTRDECLNKILAKSAFVQVPNAESIDIDGNVGAANLHTSGIVPTHWWDGTPIQEGGIDDPAAAVSRPLATTSAPRSMCSSSPPALYTGWNWPPGCCPYYRTSYKKRAKTFLSHHGSIYRPVYDQMVEQLLSKDLPAMHNEPNANEDSSVIQNGANDAAATSAVGRRTLSNMLPAFFETLIALLQLSNHNLTCGTVLTTTRPLVALQSYDTVKIVLRTFGTDLDDVAQAVSLFARGQHPDYPQIQDERLVLNYSTHCFKGRWASIPGEATATAAAAAFTKQPSTMYEYQLWNHDNQVVAAGDAQVLDFIHTSPHTICGIQDDYEHWDKYDCQPWAGKPVWTLPKPPVTQASMDDFVPLFHHVLLDDNIHNNEHDSIASVRVGARVNDELQFRTLSGREILDQQGLHLIRVPTVEPILNLHWFIEQIEKAVQRLDDQ